MCVQLLLRGARCGAAGGRGKGERPGRREREREDKLLGSPPHLGGGCCALQLLPWVRSEGSSEREEGGACPRMPDLTMQAGSALGQWSGGVGVLRGCGGPKGVWGSLGGSHPRMPDLTMQPLPERPRHLFTGARAPQRDAGASRTFRPSSPHPIDDPADCSVLCDCPPHSPFEPDHPPVLLRAWHERGPTW